MADNIAAFTFPAPLEPGRYVDYVSINRQPAGGVGITIRGDNSQAYVWLPEDAWQALRKQIWHRGKAP